jgi:hypothetical protein
MEGAAFMVKRAEYRKLKEAQLFEQVMAWATEDDDPLVVEIVARAFEDNNAEHWLTIHPTSSFTGLTLYYMDIIVAEKELVGNERRLLVKRMGAYAKRLLG